MVATTMAQGIFEDVELRYLHVLSLIDPNRVEPGTPIAWLNLRDGVRASLRLRDYVTDALKLSWKEAIDNQVEDYNAAGKLCMISFEVALKAIRAVQRTVDRVAPDGWPNELDAHFEEELAKLRQTIPDLEAARDDFAARWPWFNEKRLLESLATDRRGEHGRSARDAFREIRSRVRPGGN